MNITPAPTPPDTVSPVAEAGDATSSTNPSSNPSPNQSAADAADAPAVDPFALPAMPDIRHVGVLAPLAWLRAGAADFRRHPLISLVYGVAFALMGWALQAMFEHAVEYASTLAFAFFLLGPFLATGLYETSRRIEQDRHSGLFWTFVAWRRNVAAIGIYVVIVTVIMLVAARASLITFALFFSGGLPSTTDFLHQVVSLQHLDFLFAYTIVLLLFFSLVYAISVVSVPLMLDRDTETFLACLTSLRVLIHNIPAMTFWALLILLLIGAGFLTRNLLLILTAPLVGHATWHAYRATVVAPAEIPEQMPEQNDRPAGN